MSICDRISKFSVNSMTTAFAFTPIGTWTDPLAMFAFAFGHIEAPQCVYILFQFLSHSNTVDMESEFNSIWKHHSGNNQPKGI